MPPMEPLTEDLDQLQARFAPRGGQKSATRLWADVVGSAANSSICMKPSHAERVLAQVDAARAAEREARPAGAFEKRDEQLLRKDGLDLTLQHLRSDASRMRKTLNEIDISMGRSRREQLGSRLKEQAVPRDMVQQFEDQQRVLVEQRLLLDSLRTEKQQLEDEQSNVLRHGRQTYYEYQASRKDADIEPPFDPLTIREAHAVLRRKNVDDLVSSPRPPPVHSGEHQPERDGYLLVEFHGIVGLDTRQVDSIAAIVIRVVAAHDNTVVTQATVPGSVHGDGVGPRSVELTIPFRHAGQNFVVEFTFRGMEGTATASMPLGDISEDRTEPSHLTLNVNGAWAKQEGAKSVLVAMKGIGPRDSDNRQWANTRIPVQPTGVNYSNFPGPELPPSQAHTKQRFREWQREGCPMPEDSGSFEAHMDELWKPVAGQVQEMPEALGDSREEESEGGGGFFAGFETCDDDRPRSARALECAWRLEQPARAKAITDPPCHAAHDAERMKGDAGGSSSSTSSPARAAATARPRPSTPGAQGHGDGRSSPQGGAAEGAKWIGRRSRVPTTSPRHGRAGEATVVPQSSGCDLGGSGCATAPPPRRGLRGERPATPRSRPREEAKCAGSNIEIPFVAFAGFADHTDPRGKDTADGELHGYHAEEDMDSELWPPLGAQERSRSTPSRAGAGTFGLPFAAFAGEDETPRPGFATRGPGESPGNASAAQEASAPDASTPQRQREASAPAQTRVFKGGRGYKLRPPSRDDQPTSVLFAELRAATQNSRLCKDHAQLVLDFAARIAQPGALAADADSRSEVLGVYAGMMLDALCAFEDSTTMVLWILQAALGIWDFADSAYRRQLSVALFDGFQRSALRLGRSMSNSVEVHSRLLAGLVAVITLDCVIDEQNLINYVLSVMARHRARIPPATAEHSLGIFCIAGSLHRVAEQIGNALLVLRGFKSDAHLATRALVTIAEVLELVETSRIQARASKDSYLRSRAIPQDAADVRLVCDVMDLYPDHRKLVGAALRALAVLARTSRPRLEVVVSECQRSMSLALRRHVGSRSVSLHVAEVCLAAAEEAPQIVSQGTILLVAHALRAYWRDPGVAHNALLALAILAEGEHAEQVAEVFSTAQVLLLGDLHHSDPSVAAPLCRLVAAVVVTSEQICEDVGKGGIVALCVRALEANQKDIAGVLAAARALKALVTRSREAMQHASRLGASRSLFDVLVVAHTNARAVHALLSALAVVGQDKYARSLLVDPEAPGTEMALAILVRAAMPLVLEDADILAQVCMAFGVLSFFGATAECKRASEEVRKVLASGSGRQALQSKCDEIGIQNPEFTLEAEYFELLMRNAPFCDLRAERLLSPEGNEVAKLRLRGEDKPEDDNGEAVSKTKAAQQRSKGKSSNKKDDVFAPLRSLGIGKAAIDALPDEDQFPDLDERQAASQEDAGVLGFFNAFFGGVGS